MTPDEEGLAAARDALDRANMRLVRREASKLASICRVTTDGGRTWRNWPEGTHGDIKDVRKEILEHLAGGK